jgi:TolA-binding protein
MKHPAFHQEFSMRSVSRLLVLAMFLAGSTALYAQDKAGSKTAGSKSSSATKSETKETRVRGVLPQYFGKISLSDEQKQKIYKIQNEYSDRIDELEKKIEEMKAERNGKYMKELTKAQKERLDELKKARDKDDEKDK